MKLFRQVPENELQGVPAIPAPVDDVGPHYSGPHFEPHHRRGWRVKQVKSDVIVWSEWSDDNQAPLRDENLG